MGNGLPASAVTINYNCGAANQAAKMSCNGFWPLGGTEVRALMSCDGKLIMGTGYWMDVPTANDQKYNGAAILQLKDGNSQFEIEHVFPPQDNAVTMLLHANFRKPTNVWVPVASTWNSAGFSNLYYRDYATNSWHFAQTIAQSPSTAGSDTNATPQIRSAIVYDDPVTNISRLFLGESPNGIFSLPYDTTALGKLGKAKLELSIKDIPPLPNSRQLRVMSFGILKNKLYATVSNRLYERVNGISPTWRLAFEDPDVGMSETGYRGLTPVGDNYFFAAREGTKGAICKLTPPTSQNAPWTQTVAFDLIAKLSAAWGALYGQPSMKSTYTISGYNNMVWFQPSAGSHWALWIGLQSVVVNNPPSMPVVKAGKDTFAANGTYLVWNFNAKGDWHIGMLPLVTAQPMVSLRVGLPAPFQGATRFYMGGFDCNHAAAHNTAYLVSAPFSRLIEGEL
jgi:hypothetical protein